MGPDQDAYSKETKYREHDGYNKEQAKHNSSNGSAPAATPVKPNAPAMMATMKAISAHPKRSISFSFRLSWNYLPVIQLWIVDKTVLSKINLYNGNMPKREQAF